jgi:hypothetical protein
MNKLSQRIVNALDAALAPLGRNRTGRKGSVTDNSVATLSNLIGHFHDRNRGMFKDSRDQHMKEATKMIRSVEQTYLSELSPLEREVYHQLPDDRMRDAFRICRDLGKRAPGKFPMAAGHLADRLGCQCVQGDRVLKRLVGYGILCIVTKGTRHRKHAPGKTTIYRWTLSDK